MNKIPTDAEFRQEIKEGINKLMLTNGKTYKATIASVGRQLDFPGLKPYMGGITSNMNLCHSGQIRAFFAVAQ